MTVSIDPDKFRPLGKRVLVRRYSLPEQSAGGIYVLGRDYPTMGEVVKKGNGKYEVQWEIKADFERRIIGPDLLLLDEDDINLDIIEGRAWAANDRVLVSNIAETEITLSLFATKALSKFVYGTVESCGEDVPTDIMRRDRVIFDRSFASEIYLKAYERHLIVRYEHCVAVVEDDDKCD